MDKLTTVTKHPHAENQILLPREGQILILRVAPIKTFFLYPLSDTQLIICIANG